MTFWICASCIMSQITMYCPVVHKHLVLLLLYWSYIPGVPKYIGWYVRILDSGCVNDNFKIATGIQSNVNILNYLPLPYLLWYPNISNYLIIMWTKNWEFCMAFLKNMHKNCDPINLQKFTAFFSTCFTGKTWYFFYLISNNLFYLIETS